MDMALPSCDSSWSSRWYVGWKSNWQSQLDTPGLCVCVCVRLWVCVSMRAHSCKLWHLTRSTASKVKYTRFVDQTVRDMIGKTVRMTRVLANWTNLPLNTYPFDTHALMWSDRVQDAVCQSGHRGTLPIFSSWNVGNGRCRKGSLTPPWSRSWYPQARGALAKPRREERPYIRHRGTARGIQTNLANSPWSATLSSYPAVLLHLAKTVHSSTSSV